MEVLRGLITFPETHNWEESGFKPSSPVLGGEGTAVACRDSHQKLFYSLVGNGEPCFSLQKLRLTPKCMFIGMFTAASQILHLASFIDMPGLCWGTKMSKVTIPRAMSKYVINVPRRAV